MAKEKKTLSTNHLSTNHPLTIEEAYASRPRLWWIYTLIILIVAALLGWSGTSITYKGLATKGITIAQGVGYGLIHIHLQYPPSFGLVPLYTIPLPLSR